MFACADKSKKYWKIRFKIFFFGRKVNSALKKHFEEVGATMSKEWAERAGSRGQAVLAAYK